MFNRKVELENQMRGGQNADVNQAFELVQLYNALQEQGPLQQLLGNLLRSNLPPEITMQLAQMLVQMKRLDLVEPVFMAYLKIKPDDLRVQIDLAALRVATGRTGLALENIKAVIEKGGEPVRVMIRKDTRFQSLWNDARFQALVPPAAPGTNLQSPFGAASQPGLLSF
jgi:uncharacterized protein (UPF0297 family)